MHIMSRRQPWMLRLAWLSLLAMTAAACGIDKQSAPTLAGPSEFGLSIVAAASPDQLPRDGSSQSIVVLTVRDDKSRPVSGQRLGVAVAAGSAPGVGLSESEVVTGSDGRASFGVIAPPQSAVGSSQITIRITPIGGNFDNAVARTVTIALTGIANASTPAPAFVVTPVTPEVLQAATFNASGTTDENKPCNDACTYSWDFDDGATAAGRIVTHAYATGRIYAVTLTVTDAAGTTASLRQLVTVTAPAAPTVVLAVSPNPPTVGQQATFTATATPAPNHSIVRYAWIFGDGTSNTTTAATVTKTYNAAGTYVVTVTATDDLAQAVSASKTITLDSGITFPVPAFTVSPTKPTVGDTVNLNAGGVTASNGATVVSYAWDFGDGTLPQTVAGPTTTHGGLAGGFVLVRTYLVRLTVTDSHGRTATATVALEVGAPLAVVPFTVSPTNPRVGDTVSFNANGVTTPNGSTITSYAWDFGDGTAVVTSAQPTTTHGGPAGGFTLARTYIVRLTITDSQGRTATTTQNVIVAAAGS